MREDLKRYYEESRDVFGHPQTYKGVDFYPILMKDLSYQNLFYQIFARPKNYIASVEILKMSFIKFIIWVMANIYETEENARNKLLEMLKYLTKKDDVEIIYSNTGLEGWEAISITIAIGNVVFTEDDFENIREIVLEQNNLSVEYVESYNPELEPYLEFINTESKDITFMDQVYTYCALMKVDVKTIEGYTLYQFNNLFEKVLTLKEYDLYKPLLTTGKITLKNGEDIKHYYYHSKKSGRYDGVTMSVDAFNEKNKDTF